MPDHPASTFPRLRLDRLDRAVPHEFELRPDPDARAALAEALGIPAIRKLRLAGRLVPEARRDWRLEADLGATVVQPCAVTLVPVTTRIDEKVTRRWLADLPPDPPGEMEMPEDETVEPLEQTVDLSAVMSEAVALALPPFPRAEDAELGEVVAAPPGVAPLTDAEVKPLAGLASLRDRLETKQDSDDDDV